MIEVYRIYNGEGKHAVLDGMKITINPLPGDEDVSRQILAAMYARGWELDYDFFVAVRDPGQDDDEVWNANFNEDGFPKQIYIFKVRSAPEVVAVSE